jgi:hypothetical protein
VFIKTGDMLSAKGSKGSSGRGGEGMYQQGLEYWLSLELACTWSSGAGAEASKLRQLNIKMAEMIEPVNCILVV